MFGNNKKWEYSVKITSKKENVNIGEMGLQGWELVAVVPVHKEDGWQDYRHYFKREIK